MLEPLSGQKQKGESRKAVQACNDWLRLGASRSLPKLLERYSETQENSAPTEHLNTLQRWSSDYKWSKRAEEYDTEIERQKNERRKEVMESGLALDYERTDKLKELAHFLIDQLYEQGEDGSYHNLWVPDVKQIGSGEFAERVDIEHFNAAIIGQLRGVLDDIAKEKGDRAQKLEHSGHIESRMLVIPPKDE